MKRLLAVAFVTALACHPAPSRAPSAAPVASRAAASATAPQAAAVGARGMVVSDAALATEVGRDVLARGGNAVDAAIATAFALAVVYPAAGNVGGGGFMLARMGGTTYALDFRETAPMRATRDIFVGKPEDAQIGARSVGVPGSVDGLHRAFVRLGSKRVSWGALLAPAIALAERGFAVDQDFAAFVGAEKERLGRFAASRALFLPGGSPPPVGSPFHDMELAKVLRRVAVEGREGFYAGPTAEAIVREIGSSGGVLGLEDLARYEAKWRAPLVFTYRGRQVHTMPPPSSGGIAVGMMCHLLEAWDLRRVGFHSAEHVQLETEAMRRAFAARNARLGDPDFVENPVGELMGEAWTRAQRATILKGRATPSREIDTRPQSREGMHTTHLSVVDANGDAVALTTTINDWFGSGVTVRGAGFVLNDEMDDFAAVPGAPNMYGLVQAEPNAVAPGKRMLSSMSPTIVVAPDGKAELVTGAAGGPRIITAVFQILSNVLDFGMNAEEAVKAPRAHMQHLPDALVVEDGGLPPEVTRALRAMGYEVQTAPHLADAVAIGRAAQGWLGAPEPRRPGARALGP